MVLVLRETPSSPPTAPFKETLTLISSDQAEAQATSLAGSADMVSHLSSTDLGSNHHLTLSSGTSAKKEIRGEFSFSIHLHYCG